MTVSRQYTQELRDNINYSATWLPTITVSPGDIGRLVNYEYQPVTTLTALQIPFEIMQGKVQTGFDYASAGSVSLVFKASGHAPLASSRLAQGEASFHIQSSRENAVVFCAVNCVSSIIKKRVQLEKEIINRYRDGDWQKDWVVIVEAVSAHSSTILISSGTQAHLDLKAGGKASVAVCNLADVNARFRIVRRFDDVKITSF